MVSDPRTQQACIARGGRWENGVCFMPDIKEERKKGALSPRDPARKELRQKQLREDPLFAEKLRVVGGREAERVAIQAQEELITPEQRAIEAKEKEIEEEVERITREEAPKRFELDQPALLGTATPLIGGVQRGVTNALAKTTLAIFGKTQFGKDLQESLGRLTEEDIQSLAITEIQKEDLRQGTTLSEDIGQIIESLPGAAKLGSWADIETPRSNAEEVFKDIKSQRRQIQKIVSDVRFGYKDVDYGNALLTDIESYTNWKKERLRLLIMNSPSLNFNSDRVNRFESDLFAVDQAIFDAKIEIAKGQIIDPTELDLLNKMQGDPDDYTWVTSEW